MKILLDSDILVYRIGFTTMEDDVNLAYWRMNELVERILLDTEATSYQLYLTASKDSTAFRRKVYPEYKAHRKAEKPTHYDALREYLVKEWGAEMVETIEADDAMGMAQTDETMIVSIDKDLDMIPGWHYNFVKEVKYYVDEWQGIYNFYKQCLMGDRADNVKGIEGIGEKKAERLLAECTTEDELFHVVQEAYGNDAEFLMNAEVLWILRKPFPQGRWSLSTYGTRLKQGVDSLQDLDLKQEMHSMESTGEEMLKDGFPPNGEIQTETSIQEERNQI